MCLEWYLLFLEMRMPERASLLRAVRSEALASRKGERGDGLFEVNRTATTCTDEQ